MLEMDEGRISFAESLRPPAGYRTAFVVGTTYTLDLRALLGICIPLGLGFEPEALDNINPVSLFAALQELQGKMVVFCDKGHINADIGGDARSQGLAILLEDMIHQVHVNKRHPNRKRRYDGLSSFHPKVWVSEYEPVSGKGHHCYRLIVMSRNLTFDTSWDAAIAIDGHPGSTNACGGHVADFLEFLALGDSLTSTEKDNTQRRGSHSRRILKLAKAMRSVEFEITERDFDSVDFLPFGPRKDADEGKLLNPYESELVNARYRNLLVASPFLSDAKDSPLQLFLDKRSGKSGRFLLMSREDSLSHMNDEMRAAYECYAPAPWLSDVPLEGDGDDAPEAANYSNLHAKVYYTEESSSKRHLYIGSLNASRNGMVNNVEAMLHLSVRSGRLMFDKVARAFLGNEKKNGAFVPYRPMLVNIEVDVAAERFKRVFQASAKSVDFKAVSVVADETAYRIDVELDLMPAADESGQISYTLRPLLAMIPEKLEIGPKGGATKLSFAPVKLEQASALFVLEGLDAEGHTGSTIIVCPRNRFDDSAATTETRSRALLESILAAHEGSLSLYIAHAFGVEDVGYGGGAERVSVGSAASHSNAIAPGLYERLLERAYSDPGTIRRAEYLVGMLPDGVASEQVEELKALVAAFQKAVS